jgi:hypothetical protein
VQLVHIRPAANLAVTQQQRLQVRKWPLPALLVLLTAGHARRCCCICCAMLLLLMLICPWPWCAAAEQGCWGDVGA